MTFCRERRVAGGLKRSVPYIGTANLCGATSPHEDISTPRRPVSRARFAFAESESEIAFTAPTHIALNQTALRRAGLQGRSRYRDDQRPARRY